MQKVLDKSIYDKIKLLCADGDGLMERNEFQQALTKYNAALKLVPDPFAMWEAATWIFVAIGDAHFQSGNMNDAYTAFCKATNCPNGIGNPFIHLRLGEIQFELGNGILAADELARAYMSGGSKIFAGEPEKYFDLVNQKLKEPPNGWT